MTSDKRDFLFRYVPPKVRCYIKYDDESLYSTTDQVTANKIAKELLKYTSKDSIITDATACIGGSAVSLSKIFKQVNAIEIDEERFKLLKHNIEILQCNNVNCINSNSIEECKKIYQDVIFLDPPWGGPEYKKSDNIDLFMSNIPFTDVCNLLSDYCKFIVIKVPINFNEEKFIENTKNKLELVYKNTNLRKMHLLIFSNVITM